MANEQPAPDDVQAYLDDFVGNLPRNNHHSFYMGRTRNRDAHPVAENGDDILRVTATLESISVSERTNELVGKLAGYRASTEENLFSDHLTTLQNEGMIVYSGTSLTLTEAGRDFVRDHERDWFTAICGNHGRYQVFRNWCLANNVEHLLHFSHQAQTNLEVLQRFLTFCTECLKAEQVFRHLFAHPNERVTREYRQQLIDRYQTGREMGRYLNGFLRRVGRGQWPRELFPEFFPEGRQPVIWRNQPVFFYRPEERLVAEENARLAQAAQAAADGVEQPAQAPVDPAAQAAAQAWAAQAAVRGEQDRERRRLYQNARRQARRQADAAAAAAQPPRRRIPPPEGPPRRSARIQNNNNDVNYAE